MNQENQPAGPNAFGAGNPDNNRNPKEDPAEVALKKLNGKVKRDKALPDNPVTEVRLFSQEVTDDDL